MGGTAHPMPLWRPPSKTFTRQIVNGLGNQKKLSSLTGLYSLQLNTGGRAEPWPHKPASPQKPPHPSPRSLVEKAGSTETEQVGMQLLATGM